MKLQFILCFNVGWFVCLFFCFLVLIWKDAADAALDDDQLYAVELSRGTRGFGFSIRGGREFHQMPLFVLRIADNGSAAQDGRLRVSFGLKFFRAPSSSSHNVLIPFVFCFLPF